MLVTATLAVTAHMRSTSPVRPRRSSQHQINALTGIRAHHNLAGCLIARMSVWAGLPALTRQDISRYGMRYPSARYWSSSPAVGAAGGDEPKSKPGALTAAATSLPLGRRIRYEYHLSPAGEELRIVLGALQQRGDQHCAPAAGPSAQRRSRSTGARLDVAFTDESGRVVALDEVTFVAV